MDTSDARTIALKSSIVSQFEKLTHNFRFYEKLPILKP